MGHVRALLGICIYVYVYIETTAQAIGTSTCRVGGPPGAYHRHVVRTCVGRGCRRILFKGIRVVDFVFWVIGGVGILGRMLASSETAAHIADRWPRVEIPIARTIFPSVAARKRRDRQSMYA